MDTREVQELSAVAIKRAAMSQPHEVRKVMLKWAELFDGGAKLDDGDMLVIMLPVKKEGKTYAAVTFAVSDDGTGMPCATAEVERTDENGIPLRAVADNPQA